MAESGMLGWRIGLSVVIVPALIGAFYFDAILGGRAPVLFALCVLLALRGTWELTALLRTRSFRPQWPATALGAIAVLAAGWVVPFTDNVNESPAGIESLGPMLLAFALVVMALMLKETMRYREPGGSMETLGAELLTVSYVGLFLAVTAQLRWVAGAEAGYLVLGSLVVCAKCGDIGAYTLGRLFGRRKMAPRLSPGKTWMGAVGALGGAGAAGFAWLTWATPAFNPAWQPPCWCWRLAYGAVIGVAGLLGDLCESLIKRDVGRKDAAPLMPGFGGLLDLLDSVLYAGPVAYVLWLWWPLRTW